MYNLVKIIGNAALVVGGFFVVLFGTSRFTDEKDSQNLTLRDAFDASAHADAPYGEGAYYGEASYGGDGGGTGDSGSGGSGTGK